MDLNGGFLKIPNFVLNSCYYRHILNSTDKNVLNCLWSNVSIGSSKYFKNGLLIANIKEATLMEKSGETYPTLTRHLKRLDSLGVIITKRSKVKHNRYLVGFRTRNNERLYLLYHLIEEYEKNLKRNIANQINEFDKIWQSPSIKDISPYRIDIDYKRFMFDHIDRPNELVNKRVKNNKTMFELLFNRSDIYRKALPNIQTIGL